MLSLDHDNKRGTFERHLGYILRWEDDVLISALSLFDSFRILSPRFNLA